MTNNVHPGPSAAALTWREKLSYGMADMGFNFYWANIATFLMFFYTDVFGISGLAAGAMLGAIKFINAFTDPLIGAVADRTHTRFGKFRPYLLWMALPLAAAGVLTYTTPNLAGEGKLIYAYATYLFMMLCYTGINIPYNALSGVMSSNPQERSMINALRFVCAYGGNTLVVAVTPRLVKWLGAGNAQLGWQLTMVFWGVAASAVFVLAFFNTRERIAPPPAQKTNLVQDVKDLSRNGPWLVLFFLAPIIMITITLRGATAPYYLKYVVGREDLLGRFLGAYPIAAVMGAALTPVLTRLMDKRRLMILLMGITGMLSLAFYFVQREQIVLMFALQILMGLVLGPKSPLAFAMYADVADLNEWRTGRRATGLTFAAATFSQKLGTAVAAMVMGSVFSALGYVANTAQTANSQKGILLLMSVIPAVFAFLAVVVMLFYKLDSRQLAQVEADLAARKAGADS